MSFYLITVQLICLKCRFYPQHLFPDADQDLEDLEIEQQQLLFNKMESSKDAKWDQGPQVQTDYFLDFNIFYQECQV